MMVPKYKKKKKHSIVFITLPLPLHNKAGLVILMKFMKILEPLSHELYVITGNLPQNIYYSNKIFIKSVKHNTLNDSIIIKAIKYIYVQFKLSYYLLKTPEKDIVFLMGSALILPLLSAKLVRRKTVMIMIGLQSKSSERLHGGLIFSHIFRSLERINCVFSDKIIVESNNVMTFFELSRYKYKISIGSLYIDTSIFKNTIELKDRKSSVGYIGRFSDEKGILNFIGAIPTILSQTNDIKILIGGGGPLYEEIKRRIEKYQNERISLYNWISHEELPNYLNELKLLVLPSYTEGLPNIVLEAMACGTPVLATSVGGVPDVIKDEITGFILENNSPECIAKSMIRILEHPNLDEIANNARKLIEKNYTYETAVERYRELFKKFDQL